MSPGPSPRSSQWSALQPWSVSLLLRCLTSPVWVAHVDWPRLWPPLTHCPWWELLARGNSGDAWGSSGGRVTRGQRSHGRRGLRVRHYWNTERCWDVSLVSRHQTLSPVISQSCAPSIIRSPGISPLLSLNRDPEALSTLSRPVASVSAQGGSLHISIHHALTLFRCHNYQCWWQIHA